MYLGLNIKKTRLGTIDTTEPTLELTMKIVNIFDSLCLLGLTINNKEI